MHDTLACDRFIDQVSVVRHGDQAGIFAARVARSGAHTGACTWPRDAVPPWIGSINGNFHDSPKHFWRWSWRLTLFTDLPVVTARAAPLNPREYFRAGASRGQATLAGGKPKSALKLELDTARTKSQIRWADE